MSIEATIVKRLLTTACLVAVTTVAIGPFMAAIVFAHEQQAAKEWRFDQAQPDWKPAMSPPATETVELERTTDALRVTLSEGSRIAADALLGGVYVDLADCTAVRMAVKSVALSVVNWVSAIAPPEALTAFENSSATPWP